MIQVYTGDGKGKTTASIGLAIRAKGRNKKVIVIHFLKSEKSGEDYILDKLGIPVYMFGAGFFDPKNPPEKIKKIVENGIHFALETINSGNFDIVILDELNYVFFVRLFDPVIFFDEIKRAKIELIITGRNAPKYVIERADLVTEMKEVKHYFHNGVDGRPGIEY